MELPLDIWQTISDKVRLWEQIYISQLNSDFKNNIQIKGIIKPSVIYLFLQESYKRQFGNKIVLIKKNDYSIFRIFESQEDHSVMRDITEIITKLLKKKDRLCMDTNNGALIKISIQKGYKVKNVLEQNGYRVILI